MNESFHTPRSLWQATARAGFDTAPLAGTMSADVAVIGAGFTGLSAALHLAETGMKVIVLDKQGPGWGGSGSASPLMSRRWLPTGTLPTSRQSSPDRLSSVVKPMWTA